jgi:hypothetical protein
MSVQDNPSMDRTYRLDLIVSIKEAQLVQDHVNGRSGGTSKRDVLRATCHDKERVFVAMYLKLLLQTRHW